MILQSQYDYFLHFKKKMLNLNEVSYLAEGYAKCGFNPDLNTDYLNLRLLCLKLWDNDGKW